jgi:hypothetical protein
VTRERKGKEETKRERQKTVTEIRTPFAYRQTEKIKRDEM